MFRTVRAISAVQNGQKIKAVRDVGKSARLEEFIFNAMRARFKNFQVRHDREEKVNPKLTAHQIELAHVVAEIEKLLAGKKGWKLDDYDPGDLKVHPSEDSVPEDPDHETIDGLALAVKVSNCKYYVTVNVAVDKSGL